MVLMNETIELVVLEYMTLDFKTKGLLVSDWPYLVRIFQVTYNGDKSEIRAYEILYICPRLVGCLGGGLSLPSCI
jgi:hypothetical protein